jgi:Transcription elongation factor
MSRAFVKEPDSDQVGDDQPDLPESPYPNYVTPAGLAALKARLAELKSEHEQLLGQPETPEPNWPWPGPSGTSAISNTGWRTPSQWIPRNRPRGEVAFGATITVEDPDGKKRDFTIVGEDEADAGKGKVSWVSPLARALDGAKVGQTVTWKRPAGDLELEVLAIRYT